MLLHSLCTCSIALTVLQFNLYITVYNSRQDILQWYIMNMTWKLQEPLKTSLELKGILSVSILQFYRDFRIMQTNLNMTWINLYTHWNMRITHMSIFQENFTVYVDAKYQHPLWLE